MGNTDLDPEYTDAYEIGAVYNLQKASLYLGGYYRFTTGVIERVSTSEDGINTISTPQNIGTENAFGLEANFSLDPVGWYNLNGNANLYRSITDGSYGDLILSRDTYSARFRLNNRFKLGKVNAQLSGNYRAPEVTTQGRRDAMYSIDAGVNMDVLKGNGTLNLSARDVFNTRKYRGITETDSFWQESEFQWRAGEVRLSFVYRLNQKKSRSRGSGRGYGGDEGDF
jgi:outer membrane receptor protein involved in Fe transport